MTLPRRLAALGLTAGLCASCAPRSVTPQGREINWLYDLFFAVAIFVFVLVAGLIGWSIVRYRAKPGDEDRLPKQTHTNIKLEVTWFAIPTLIVFALFGFSARTMWDLGHDPHVQPLEVEVEGFQWGWSFAYEGVRLVSLPDEPATVVLPVDRPIRFFLQSPDVIHNFSVPRFLIRRDVIPGRTNQIDITIDRPGRFRGVCAEFCGLLHDRMNFTVQAVSEDDYETWRADNQDGAP